MAFVDLPTLDGGSIHLSTAVVHRITRGPAAANGTATVRVDYAGDYQLTTLAADAVAALFRNAGMKLVGVTAPDGTAVFLSAQAITVVKDADPHLAPPGGRTLIRVAALRQFVRESQSEVAALIAAAT